MRRRWRWPILEVLKQIDGDELVDLWVGWLILGFVLAVIPALIVSADKHGDVHMTGVLMWTLIGWGVPVVLPLACIIGDALLTMARLCTPHRVTEPVSEDLRSVQPESNSATQTDWTCPKCGGIHRYAAPGHLLILCAHCGTELVPTTGSRAG